MRMTKPTKWQTRGRGKGKGNGRRILKEDDQGNKIADKEKGTRSGRRRGRKGKKKKKGRSTEEEKEKTKLEGDLRYQRHFSMVQ